MNIAAALRAVRAGRDKAAFYRMWHVRERAGLPWPKERRAPGTPVPFEVALLALGKEAGKTEVVVRLLADYFAAEDRMMLGVLKKASYPMFVALAAAVIGPLPLLFRGHAGLYGITSAGGVLLWIAAGGSLLVGVAQTFLARPKFVIGRLLRALTFAVEAGLPISRAAELAAAASGSAAIVAHVRRVGTRAVAGQPLATTFAGCPVIPVSVLAAMNVADASGDYTGTLRRLADLTES